MLHENLILLRKSRGMSQEVMAECLHVVRQTVSKWERGVSVPDAEMLTKIADLFGVSVSELLGEAKAENLNEVAVQLALLNEQFAERSRRSRRIWNTVAIVLLVLFALWLLVNFGSRIATPVAGPDLVIRMECTLDGETYIFSIDCDDRYGIMAYGGDPWIYDNVVKGAMQYSDYNNDAYVLVDGIEAYFISRGGSVTIQEVKRHK